MYIYICVCRERESERENVWETGKCWKYTLGLYGFGKRVDLQKFFRRGSWVLPQVIRWFSSPESDGSVFAAAAPTMSLSCTFSYS